MAGNRGGAPKGNKNAAGRHKGGPTGNKNAVGHHEGAPLRNKNAEKDGAYSAVYFDELTQGDRDVMERTPLEARAAAEDEMKLLKIRENRILKKIAQYESEDENAVFLNSVTEITGGKSDLTYRMSESAFKRWQNLHEALHRVQGRIIKIAAMLRAMDESEQRLGMERERLDIQKMRVTGGVDVDGLEESDVPDKILEDVIEGAGV